MKIIFILIIIIVFVIFPFFNIHITEHLDATIVSNPFSDIRCITDDQPMIRFIEDPVAKTTTFQCLSKDGINCMMRSDFGVEGDIKCNDINTYLVKELRDSNSKPRKIFNDLDQNTNYQLLTCNPDGLNNTSHWCGKMYTGLQNTDCNPPSGKISNTAKFGYLSTPCKELPKVASLPPVGSNVKITSSSDIIAAKASAKARTDAARNARFTTASPK